MKFTPPAFGNAADERLDALFARQPIVPAPDFVQRTLERVRAQADLVSLARTGDEAAIDALLDNWLSDQPVNPVLEPAQAAIRTRRAATPIEAQPTPAPWRRRLFVFPAWAQSAGALAAAAAVAFLAFFNDDYTVKQPAKAPSMAANFNQHIPAPVFSDSTDGDNGDTIADSSVDVPSLNSLSDAAALLDNNNVDLLMSATQSDDSGVY